MAEEKHVEKADEVKSTEVKKVNRGEKRWLLNNPSWVPMALLAVLFLGLLWAAFSLGQHNSNRSDRGDSWQARGTRQHDFAGPLDMRGGMMMGDAPNSPRGDYNDGSGASTVSSTRVSGVVTAVDGNTVTVAGSGTTTMVQVSDSTTYSGSEKPPKVNDTIVAFGARDSSNNLVAASVRLVRQ